MPLLRPGHQGTAHLRLPLQLHSDALYVRRCVENVAIERERLVR